MLTVVPAYGRDYKSKQEVLLDWEANKDFQLPDGRYVNKQQVPDLRTDGVRHLTFRYWRLSKSFEIKVAS